MRGIRDDLERRGFRVTSRWLDSASSLPATASTDDDGAAARLAAIAVQDMADIDRADLVVVFNPAAARAIGRGGRHVETGYALARAKPVVVVGVRGNVFHWLPEVTVVAGWDGLAGHLATLPV